MTFFLLLRAVVKRRSWTSHRTDHWNRTLSSSLDIYYLLTDNHTYIHAVQLFIKNFCVIILMYTRKMLAECYITN